MVRCLDEFDSEQELYGAHQEAAEVEYEGEGAEYQRHIVNGGELIGADEAVGRERDRGHPYEKCQGYERQDERYYAQQTEARQHFLESWL